MKKERQIIERLKLTKCNTSAWIHPVDESILIFYHGNLISRIIPWNKQLTVSNAGWYTATTKKRINQIFKAFGIDAYIYQRDFTWYLVYKGCEFDYSVVSNVWFKYTDNPLF